MESLGTTEKGVAAPGPISSGACRSYRTPTHCEPVPVTNGPVAGETTPIIPEDGAGEDGSTGKKQTRKHTPCNPHVFEAMRILQEHGYNPRRMTGGANHPVTIVAQKGPEMLMIAVIWSRKSVQDAKTLRQLFPDKVEETRAYANPRQFRTMIWVTSPIIGWRYYRVDTGGLSYDWDFAKMMKE